MPLLVCCRVVKKFAPAAAALLACAALSLSGCGGPPEDASVKDFCAQLEKVNGEKSWKAIKAGVLEFKDLGTPKGIPADARMGFVELIGLTEATTSRGALAKKVEKMSKGDRARFDAFDGYVAKTCAE